METEDTSSFEDKYNSIMDQIQEEWSNNETYKNRRNLSNGIRSSQLAALVGFLIKRGIIK